MNKTTKELENVLSKTHPDNIDEYFDNEKDELINDQFSNYMKSLIKKKKFLLQTVFLRADISERYGYKLLSNQKHTIQRDIILRICYASEFSLEETNRALKLYGMSPLYARIKRDAILMVAFENRPGDILDLNQFLKENNVEPLRNSGDID